MRFDIIALERQFASGGLEIGRQLAKKLQIPCYGPEILQSAAERIGADPAYLEKMDETAPSSLLFSLYSMSSTVPFDSTQLMPESALHQAECEIIRELAAKGPCVLVGRCAGAILKDRPDVLRAFIYADMAFREQRAQEVYGLKPETLTASLRRYDRRRANYYNFYSIQKWDDRTAYHLMLDSGKLGIEGCADILVQATR